MSAQTERKRRLLSLGLKTLRELAQCEYLMWREETAIFLVETATKALGIPTDSYNRYRIYVAHDQHYSYLFIQLERPGQFTKQYGLIIADSDNMSKYRFLSHHEANTLKTAPISRLVNKTTKWLEELFNFIEQVDQPLNPKTAVEIMLQHFRELTDKDLLPENSLEVRYLQEMGRIISFLEAMELTHQDFKSIHGFLESCSKQISNCDNKLLQEKYNQLQNVIPNFFYFE